MRRADLLEPVKNIHHNGLISEEKILAAEAVLVDNGIDPEEADVVLQAIGYTLLDTELYKED